MANGIYVLNVVLWMLFIFYIGLIVFRGIITAHRIRSNEIYGTIYVYPMRQGSLRRVGGVRIAHAQVMEVAEV